MVDSKLVLELSSCPPEQGNGLQHVAKQPLLQQQPLVSLITKLSTTTTTTTNCQPDKQSPTEIKQEIG
jgi:hypothetical protein